MFKRILVVDDNEDLRLSVIEGLTALSDDYKFVEASSGRKALELLGSGERFDVILLDIMMPDMDGWEVAAEIKADPSLAHTPIIFLTAKSDVKSKKTGDLVADDYIEKPFDVGDLKRRIDVVVNK